MRNVSLPGFVLLALLTVATPAQAQRFVCMESNFGNWCMELLWDNAPNTVTNFLRYVQGGEFDNSMIHRNVPGVALISGAFNWYSQQEGIFYMPSFGFIKHENSVSNRRGTVGMIPLGDTPDTAAQQWFINTRDNVELDDPLEERFTVFARIASGMESLDAISNLTTIDVSVLVGHSAFDSLPTTATGLRVNEFPLRKDVVIISRAYTTDLIPGTTAAAYHCSTPVESETLAEICGSSVSFPVSIKGQGFFELTLDLVSGTPPITLSHKQGSLRKLASTPAVFANYDQTTGVMTVPSVRTGLAVYKELVLKETAVGSQRFTLQSFKR